MFTNQFKLMLTSVIGLIISTPAYGGSGPQESASTEQSKARIERDLHDSVVDIKLFPRYDCTNPEPQTRPGNVPLSPLTGAVAGFVIDAGIELVSSLLSKRQGKLQATYSGIHTTTGNASVKCIEILRKEVIEIKEDGNPIFKDAMKMKVLVKPLGVGDKVIANRFSLNSIANVDAATKKSKKKDGSEKFNFAISIGMIYVDEEGNQTNLSRNLPLVENIELVPNLDAPFVVPNSSISDFAFPTGETNVPVLEEQYESSVFKPLPDVFAATVTVSITETDTRHSKATDIAELFENNKDSLDSLFDNLID